MKGTEACKGKMWLAMVKMFDKIIQEHPVIQDESKTSYRIQISRRTRSFNERSMGIMLTTSGV
jgi:hypothetical protein